MAKVYSCDRCNKQIERNKKPYVITYSFSKESWDLCDVCYNEFVKFINYGGEQSNTNDTPF